MLPPKGPTSAASENEPVGASGADPSSAPQPFAAAGDAGPSADAPVRVVDLVKSFGRVRVLRGITLSFPRGKTTVVLGPSGCGKSVLLKHLIGLLRPDRGAVYYESERIDNLPERRLAPIRRQFGFLFQQGALFDSMTVAQNIAFPLREQEGGQPYDEESRVRYVLRLVGLEKTFNRYPSELSGGQQKRVALARAVVLRPRVILYDEPTTGLDPIRSDVINELILKLKQQLDVTSIVVTHDLASAFKVADHMVMLHEGNVVLEGSPEEFRNATNPVVRRFLRGEASEEELRAIRAVGSGASGFGGGA
ncbi:MAG: putative phospholipid import ATP-binding protein MlaF [Planctomycetota bacterium]|jgi:phospholipid/cholesterol/gamma-HCH transport system ATP-binding protein